MKWEAVPILSPTCSPAQVWPCIGTAEDPAPSWSPKERSCVPPSCWAPATAQKDEFRLFILGQESQLEPCHWVPYLMANGCQQVILYRWSVFFTRWIAKFMGPQFMLNWTCELWNSANQVSKGGKVMMVLVYTQRVPVSPKSSKRNLIDFDGKSFCGCAIYLEVYRITHQICQKHSFPLVPQHFWGSPIHMPVAQPAGGGMPRLVLKTLQKRGPRWKSGLSSFFLWKLVQTKLRFVENLLRFAETSCVL